MTQSFSVVVTDHPWRSIVAEQEALGQVGAEMRFAESGEESELVSLVEDADAILTCFAHVTPAVISGAPRLQVVGRYGIGVDNIAVDEATRRGIIVTNVPVYCRDEVTDHALALMLAFARGLHTFDGGMRSGDWSLGQLGQPLRRLRGQTLGIVGLGQIGMLLAEKAQAFGLRVIGYHPDLSSERAGRHNVELVTLGELAARSDYVSLHVPLTEATAHLIDAKFLAAMKDTAFLINTARGGVIDEVALLGALQDGSIGGAGLDVFTPERIDPDHPLLSLPNVIVTPHVAYYSEESLLDLGRLAAENVASVLGGRRPAAVVNPQVLLARSVAKPARRRGGVMAYVIVATWQARAGREQEVADTIAELTEASLREPGCRFYQGQGSTEVPGQFLIYEIYDDAAAAEVHSSSEHFRRLVLERAPELLDSRSRRIFETI